MKFLLFPLIAVPIAVIVAFNSPTRKAHEAALEVASLPTRSIDTMANVAATFQADEGNMVLYKAPSTPCDNLMGPGWHEGNIEPASGEPRRIRTCWRQYSNFEAAWDGSHYGRPIIAICPLIDGISRYQGCMNTPADRFEWQPH